MKRPIAIVGAGPAGLFAAQTLAQAGAAPVVFDLMAAPLRKFLLAGRGGLNLTHGEALDGFLARYAGAKPYLEAAIRDFHPAKLREWADGLGAETFVGSSGRVFPKAMKASPLARAWLRELSRLGVELRARHRWTGWTQDGALRFETPDGEVAFKADATILALGGASWPKLGSDGAWTSLLASRGVDVAKLQPSNCGFVATWSAHLAANHAGTPLKRIAITLGDKRVRGEAMLTRDGIEGGAIYALSGPLRDAILRDGYATASIDLVPDMSLDDLRAKLDRPRGAKSFATWVRRAVALPPAALALLQEDRNVAKLDAAGVAAAIKAVPITLVAMAPIERAISTAGGVSFGGLDAHYMLRDLPGIFVAGEMLDWEAPTGGYLLQACFATGHEAAKGVLAFLGLGR